MRILFIDDDRFFSRHYVEALSDAGCEVTFCDSNNSALRALQSEPKFDVILQDVMRPCDEAVPADEGRDGLSAGIAFHRLHIQRLAPETPVVYLTNRMSISVTEELDQMPNSTVLSKIETTPYLLESIISAIYAEALERLYSQPPTPLDTTETLLTDTRREVLAYFARHPEKLHALSPRGFEQLTADILSEMGFDVELTQASRDGGVDIYAHLRHQIGSFLMIVECKKWAADKPVGIDIVQRLYGIQHAKKANKSLIVTTSYFTKPATTEAQQYASLMDLRDYDQLKEWLLTFQ